MGDPLPGLNIRYGAAANSEVRANAGSPTKASNFGKARASSSAAAISATSYHVQKDVNPMHQVSPTNNDDDDACLLQRRLDLCYRATGAQLTDSVFCPVTEHRYAVPLHVAFQVPSPSP